MESYDSNSLSVSSSSEEPSLFPSMSLKVLQRSSESTYEVSTPLCKSKLKKINPNDLVRERGFHVIEDPKFKQTIEVEECETNGSPCNYILNIKSECRQRFMNIQLRVLTSDKQEKMESFTIPSVCECAFFSRSPKIETS